MGVPICRWWRWFGRRRRSHRGSFRRRSLLFLLGLALVLCLGWPQRLRREAVVVPRSRGILPAVCAASSPWLTPCLRREAVVVAPRSRGFLPAACPASSPWVTPRLRREAVAGLVAQKAPQKEALPAEPPPSSACPASSPWALPSPPEAARQAAVAAAPLPLLEAVIAAALLSPQVGVVEAVAQPDR